MDFIYLSIKAVNIGRFFKYFMFDQNCVQLVASLDT